VNLVLIEPGELQDGRATLAGRRGRHLIDVVRVAVGDTLRLGVIRGSTGTATVAERTDSQVVVTFEADGSACDPPLVDLVLAMPRPRALSRVLQTAASFGVRRIDVINAWRVDKSYLQSGRLEPERLRQDVLLGCEQGSTAWVPDVTVHRRMMPFVDDVLTPRLAEAGTLGLLAHARATQPIELLVQPEAGSIGRTVVAIGPEGGWIQREIDTLIDSGMASVSLGPRILRTEAAVAALLAQLELLRRLSR
jgi:16S rRNA (uracil1498-N3)-methyltransferase